MDYDSPDGLDEFIDYEELDNHRQIKEDEAMEDNNCCE